MSITAKARVACHKCGCENEITVYRSINVSENPELKDKVKDGSLFVWGCPQCGSANLAKYETLYHDPSAKLMVWLLPSEQLPQEQMAAITNHARAMGGYTLRRVPDVGTLMEKVLIADAGLDDVVIEMCKFVTRNEMAASDKAAAADCLKLPMKFFKCGTQDGEKFITLSFPKDGRMVGCNIGMNVYEDCQGILQRNPGLKPGEGFAVVDSAWLESNLIG